MLDQPPQNLGLKTTISWLVILCVRDVAGLSGDACLSRGSATALQTGDLVLVVVWGDLESPLNGFSLSLHTAFHHV